MQGVGQLKKGPKLLISLINKALAIRAIAGV